MTRAFPGVLGHRPEPALLQTQLRDRAPAEARLVTIGGSGAQRAAHLMLELRDRMAERGMLPAVAADGTQSLPFPLRRRHLAAASGTRANRLPAEMEAAGLARLDGEVLTLRDPAHLAGLRGHAPLPERAGRRALL